MNSTRQSGMGIGVCVLAGGRSSRMGRDKSRLRLGRRTLLGHVKAAAAELRLPVRVIRRDLVPRCGPLGGIFTGLKTSRRAAEMFLSCDMPFVPAEFLAKVLAAFQAGGRAVFVQHGRLAGFPLIVRRADLDAVSRQIEEGEWSLQQLARALRAKRLRPGGRESRLLFNVNTPADWERARTLGG